VSDANALDAAVEVIARKYDKGAKPPRINPLDAVSSVTGQISRGIEKTQAKLKRITYQCEKTEAYTRRLLKQTRDPDAFGAVRESRRIRASAIRLQRDLNATSRDLVQVTIGQAKAVLTVAAEASMTAKELLALNVELAASPLVAAGTIVTVIKPKAA
jgi:hypothetical protein